MITKRKYTQLLAAVILNSNFNGFLTGRIYKGDLKGVCAPGLNCYSCPGALASCPLGSLQSALVKPSFKFPFYIAGTLLLFGVLFGRMICSFLCPFGFLQELLYKIPLPKIKKNRFTRILSYLKYLILAVFVIGIPLVNLAPGFCKYICPAGTLEAGIPLTLADQNLRAQIGFLFSWKVFVLVVFICVCAMVYRGFCRFVCPLGAIYSFFNYTSFFGVEVEKDKCTGCNACVKYCKMDVLKVGDRECISCGECRVVCKNKAIRYKNPLDNFVRKH
ncbi:MAG: 4Fe-4S binding protein [Lachnospiraceae bacterium]|nr:4Fe-4S binding protein [Lachnospiraceae bacterium]